MRYIKTFEKVSKNDPLIIQSAKRGSVSGVEKALKSGGDVNIKDVRNRTALMEATLNSFISVVNFLIQNGADVNLKDSDGRTALMMASTMKIINALLNAGADVNLKSYKGENAIMEYLKYETKSDKFLQYLNLFLEKGLNLDETNNEGDNLYDIIKRKEKIHTGESYKLKYYFEIEEYMNNEFPKYKEDWEIKQDMGKYNL